MSSAVKKPSQEGQLSGVLGFFPGPSAITEACGKVRDSEYKNFDCYSPFPIHGLEHVQGLKASKIPWITLIAGIIGCTAGYYFQYWTSAVDWPLNVGGKPPHSGPAFIPVTFELTILFAAIATLAAMLLMNGLPNLRRKIPDGSLTRDRFAIMIETPPLRKSENEDGEDVWTEESFNAEKAEGFLKSIGATETKKIFQEGWFK